MRVRTGSSAFMMAVLTAVISCGEVRGTLVTTTDAAASDVSAPRTVWRPSRTTTWQIQLTGLPLDASVDAQLFIVDLFYTSAQRIADLHAANRLVGCYISAGTLESYRPDVDEFPDSAIGNPVADYPDEKWLDVRDARVRSAMRARLDLAKSKGCDAVELESFSSEGANTGFSLTRADELAYARGLAEHAHLANLSVGFGGGDALMADLVADADWGLAINCLAGQRCRDWSPLLAAGKVVFLVVFTDAATDQQTVCKQATELGFLTLLKNQSLDAHRVPCS